MLSKKAKYAIKALIALADREREEPMRIADLAREEQIPPKFLELILLGLKNHGVLQSRKGKGGGYLLARDPADIYLGQIVRMFDGPARAGALRQPDRVRPLRGLPQRGGVRRAPGNEGSPRRHRQGARRHQPGLAAAAGRAGPTGAEGRPLAPLNHSSLAQTHLKRGASPRFFAPISANPCITLAEQQISIVAV